jgi:hypothetical protein
MQIERGLCASNALVDRAARRTIRRTMRDSTARLRSNLLLDRALDAVPRLLAHCRVCEHIAWRGRWSLPHPQVFLFGLHQAYSLSPHVYSLASV